MEILKKVTIKGYLATTTSLYPADFLQVRVKQVKKNTAHGYSLEVQLQANSKLAESSLRCFSLVSKRC